MNVPSCRQGLPSPSTNNLGTTRELPCLYPRDKRAMLFYPSMELYPMRRTFDNS